MKKQAKKSAKKSAKKTTKKPAAAKKAARKPAKSAAKVDEGIYIAPAEDAPEAPQKAAEAKPRKAAKRKAAKVERKATKATKAKPAAKPAADFEPVKLPAVFHSPDGGGKLEITATSITYSQGLREVIFPARSAHYFPRDYKVGGRTIAAGSVGVKVGGKSLVIGPEAPAIVAAVRTAKAAADKAAKAAKAAKAKGGAK